MANKLDGRKRAYYIPPKQPLKLTNAKVKEIIAIFEQRGYSQHSKNGGTLQYILDYCEDQKIPYHVTCFPGAGYHVQRLYLNYKSDGDAATTEAVLFLLEKSSTYRHAGPHRWRRELLRYVGRMMRDYAKYYYEQNCQQGL